MVTAGGPEMIDRPIARDRSSHAASEPRDGSYDSAQFQRARKVSWTTSSAND